MAHILVVDDIQDNRELLKLDLEDDGHKVSLAESGEQALKQLAEIDIDLVLLDINMPGMSGIDVLKAIKQNPAFENLPVLMVTANDVDSQVVQALDIGANDYITKPYSSQVLAARMRTSLRLKRALDNLRRANKRLEVMSTIDSLTGLYVRRHFFELANKEVAKSKEHVRALSVAVLDLDELAEINEQYGQGAGDSLLVQLGAYLKDATRKSDIVARIGGDTFAVCLPDTACGQAQVLMEQLLAGLKEKSFKLGRGEGGSEFMASFAVGIADYRHGEGDIAATWRRADAARYAAKKSGGSAMLLSDE